MISAIVKFPLYLAGYVVGLIQGILTDTTLTSLAVGSTALALATQVWIGVGIFFLGQVLIMAVNAHGTAIVNTGIGPKLIASQITQWRHAWEGQRSLIGDDQTQ